MPKQKGLSGKEMITFFQTQGFSIISHRGSHIKLRRFVSTTKQTLVVPNHKSIDKGTMKEIYNQARRFLDQDILNTFFYTEN